MSVLHPKRYFRCLVGGVMDRFATRLGLLPAASAGILVFAVASLALVPDQGDHERSAQYSERSRQGVEIRVSEPAELAGGTGTIVSAATFVDQPWIDRLDPGADCDESDHGDLGDDCCGVTCHAAVGGIGIDACPIRPPPSAAASTGSPSLLGRSQDPPERPPRVA